MGHEKTNRVLALEAEVARIKARLDEERGRYRVAYVTWQLAGRGADEFDAGWAIYHRFQDLKIELKKAHDLLGEAQVELAEEQARKAQHG